MEYNELLEKQLGVCGICGKPPKFGEMLHIDHDHIVKKVRGLLHRQCNAALGKLGDNEEGLQRAIAYLRRKR